VPCPCPLLAEDTPNPALAPAAETKVDSAMEHFECIHLGQSFE